MNRVGRPVVSDAMKRVAPLMLLTVAPAVFAQQNTPKTPKAAAPPAATPVGQTVDGTLALTNLDGKNVTLKDLLGKVTVLNFFAIEAESQQAANMWFAAMQREFAGKARFVHINSNAREIGLRAPNFPKQDGDNKVKQEPYARVRKHLEANKLPFEVFVDHRNRIADALGAKTTPHVLVLDATGKLIYRGFADNKLHRHVHETVQQLVAGKAVEPLETDAQGVPISRSNNTGQLASHTVIIDNPKMALEAARREQKLLLYSFVGFNCTSCRIVEQVSFRQDTLRQLLASHFVEARLHADTQNTMTRKQFNANRKLQTELARAKATPCFVVVDPTTDKVLDRFVLSGKWNQWDKSIADSLRESASTAGRKVQ